MSDISIAVATNTVTFERGTLSLIGNPIVEGIAVNEGGTRKYHTAYELGKLMRELWIDDNGKMVDGLAYAVPAASVLDDLLAVLSAAAGGVPHNMLLCWVWAQIDEHRHGVVTPPPSCRVVASDTCNKVDLDCVEEELIIPGVTDPVPLTELTHHGTRIEPRGGLLYIDGEAFSRQPLEVLIGRVLAAGHAAMSPKLETIFQKIGRTTNL